MSAVICISFFLWEPRQSEILAEQLTQGYKPKNKRKKKEKIKTDEKKIDKIIWLLF